MTKDELSDNLDYVRTLAEEGRNAPLVGGRFLVLFGVLLAVSYAGQWALLTEAFGPSRAEWFGYLWWGYAALAVSGSWLIARRVKHMPGRSSVSNKIDRAVWQGVGLAIMAIVIGCAVRASRTHDMLAMNEILASAFILYGVALGVTGVIAQMSWLRLFALASTLFGMALYVVLNEPWAYLLGAAAAIIVLVIPGVIMMRREPSSPA